jgi:hypothetical protein
VCFRLVPDTWLTGLGSIELSGSHKLDMTSTPNPTLNMPELFPDPKDVRNANRQQKFRQSAKGEAAYQVRLASAREARRRRRVDHHQRLHRAQSIAFDGRYSGPPATGVPKLGELKLENYR